MEMMSTLSSRRMFALAVLLWQSVMIMRVAAVSQQIINVDTSGCTPKLILVGGFGQSFKTNLNVVVTVSRFEFWLDPSRSSLTSYQAKLYDGSGCGGRLLGTSVVTNVAAGNLGGASGWYPFSFPNPNDFPLYPNAVYTIQVLKTTTDAGFYQLCGNKYADGKAFSNTCGGSSNNDVSFRLTVIKYPRIEPGSIVSLQTRTSVKTFVSGNNFPNAFDVNTLAANRQAVGQYELFAVEDAGNSQIAMRCLGNNLYVRFDVNRGNELRCDQPTIVPPSRFIEADVGNGASGLRAVNNNQWVGVDTNDRYVLKANQASVGPGPEEAFAATCSIGCR